MRHDVLTVDSKLLVEEYEAKITLCPYNSGSTLFNPPMRGLDTFSSIDDFDFEYWRQRRGARKAVVEVAVEYGVLNIDEFILTVEHMKGGGVLDIIYDAGV